MEEKLHLQWDNLVEEGTAIILETMVALQKQALKIIPDLPLDAIGKAIKLV